MMSDWAVDYLDILQQRGYHIILIRGSLGWACRVWDLRTIRPECPFGDLVANVESPNLPATVHQVVDCIEQRKRSGASICHLDPV